MTFLLQSGNSLFTISICSFTKKKVLGITIHGFLILSMGSYTGLINYTFNIFNHIVCFFLTHLPNRTLIWEPHALNDELS